MGIFAKLFGRKDDDKKVGGVVDVDGVVHAPVEVDLESLDVGSELDEVDERISAHERVEGPDHGVDAAPERPRALVHLERGADVLVAVLGQDRCHVRVQVGVPLSGRCTPMTADEPEGGADRPTVPIGGRRVPARMHEGLHEVRLDLRRTGA